MVNFKHKRNRRAAPGRPSPTYQLIIQPFTRDLPELEAIGHSRVAQARPAKTWDVITRETAFVMPRRGGQRFQIDGRWFSPTGGEMLIIPAGARLGYGDAPITRIDGYDLYIQLDRRTPFLGNSRYEPIRESLRSLPATLAKAPPHAVDVLRDMFRRIEHRRADPLTLPWVTLRLGWLLIELLDAVRHRSRSVEPNYVDIAEQFMTRRLAEPLTLEQLVEHTGYSRSALVEAFRQRRGVPPMEWFLRMKIDHAARRLADPQTSVSAIAGDLGFSSSQYFATVFKRFMSMTPTAYRIKLVPQQVHQPPTTPDEKPAR